MHNLPAAAKLLADKFGDQMNLDYRPGKVAFRDVLAEELGLTEQEADSLVEEREKTKLIRFDRSEELGDVWTLKR